MLGENTNSSCGDSFLFSLCFFLYFLNRFLDIRFEVKVQNSTRDPTGFLLGMPHPPTPPLPKQTKTTTSSLFALSSPLSFLKVTDSLPSPDYFPSRPHRLHPPSVLRLAPAPRQSPESGTVIVTHFKRPFKRV